MARNRVIYQSEAVYIGTTGAAPTESLRRVQSCNYNFSIARQDINQYGELEQYIMDLGDATKITGTISHNFTGVELLGLQQIVKDRNLRLLDQFEHGHTQYKVFPQPSPNFRASK